MSLGDGSPGESYDLDANLSERRIVSERPARVSAAQVSR